MKEIFEMKRQETLKNGEILTVLCFSKGTRNGFAHVVKAYYNGEEIQKKVNYLNRTWEAHPFDTATSLLIEKINKSINC